MTIGTSEVLKIQIGTIEVLRIEDANGNVLYSSAAPEQYVTVTLSYLGYDYSWTTSDGRSGSMASGDPDVSLTISESQTVTFTTLGGKQRMSINGIDQCSQMTFGYSDFADGDVVGCDLFFEPC